MQEKVEECLLQQVSQVVDREAIIHLVTAAHQAENLVRNKTNLF